MAEKYPNPDELRGRSYRPDSVDPTREKTPLTDLEYVEQLVAGGVPEETIEQTAARALEGNKFQREGIGLRLQRGLGEYRAVKQQSAPSEEDPIAFASKILGRDIAKQTRVPDKLNPESGKRPPAPEEESDPIEYASKILGRDLRGGPRVENSPAQTAPQEPRISLEERLNAKYGTPDQPVIDGPQAEYLEPRYNPNDPIAFAEDPNAQQQPSFEMLEWGSQPVYTLEDLRGAAPPRLRDMSDERLIMDFAEAYGHDPFELAEYFGVRTGADRGDFMAGLASGGDQLQNLGIMAGAGVADAVGLDSAAEYLRGQGEDQMYQGYLAGKPERERVEDIEGLGDFIDWGQYQVGKVLPTMAGIIGAQFVPGAGQAATATGLARLGTLAPRMLGGAGLRSGASFGARRAAIQQGERLGKSTLASTGIGYGSLYQASGEDGEYNPYGAAAGAPFYGAMEAAVPAAISRMVRAPARAGAGGRLRRTITGAAESSAAEAATEVGQTVMENAYDGTMTPEEYRSSLINAAAVGAVSGGTFGTVGGFFSRGEPNQPNEVGERDLTNSDSNPPAAPPKPGMTPSTPPKNAPPEVKPHVYYAGQYVPADELEQAAEQLELRSTGKMSRGDRKALDTERREVARQIGAIDNRANLQRIAQEYIRQGESRKNAQRKARKDIADQTADLQQQREYLNKVIRQSDTYAAAEAEASRIRQALRGKTVRMPVGATQMQEDAEPATTSEAEVAQEPVDLTQKKDTSVATDKPTVQETPKPAVAKDTTLETPVEREVTDDGDIEAALQKAEKEYGVSRLTTEQYEETSRAIDKAEKESLNAEITTDRDTDIDRKITLPKGVIIGIATMLRSPAVFTKPIAYKSDGTAGIDSEAVKNYGEKITSIVESAYKLIEATRVFNDKQNIFGGFPETYSQAERAEARRKLAEDNARVAANEKPLLTPEERRSYEKMTTQRKPKLALANADKRAEFDRARAEYIEATETFVQTAGGTGNANAILAAIKTRKEKSSRSANLKRFSQAGFRLGKKSALNTKDFDEFIDSQLSSGVSSFLDGTLYDTDKVSSVEFRDNYRMRKDGVTEPKLVRAAKDGGLLEILNQVAGWKGNASAYSQLLGSVLRKTLREMEKGGGKVQVKFFEPGKGRTRYEPSEGAAGTIYLSNEGTQEEILHETLHAALHWYVNSGNSDANAIVSELKQSVNAIIDYVDNGGLANVGTVSDKYKEDVQGVVEILRTLRDNGRENDAVLELISYGATLRNFRNLLKGIKEDPSPAIESWVQLLDNAWKYVVTMFRKFLGGMGADANMASNLLTRTMMLLDNSMQEDFATAKGDTLYHTISNVNYREGDESPKNAAGQSVSERLLGQSARKTADWRVGSMFIFKKLGWEKWMGKEGDRGTIEGGKLNEMMGDVARKINKKHPGLTRFIRLFNSTFAQPRNVKEALEDYKQDRGGVFQLIDSMLRSMERWTPDKVKALVKYLDDGDATALKAYKDGDKWVIVADEAKQALRLFAMALPEKDRAFFMDINPDTNQWELKDSFTEVMINIDSDKAISSHKLGLRAISDQIRATSVSLDSHDIDALDEAGFLTLNGDKPLSGTEYYRVDVSGEATGLSDYSTMVSVEVFEQLDGDITSQYEFGGQAMPVDKSKTYKFSGKIKNKYHFTAKRDYRTKLDEDKKHDLILAMRNTFGGLGNYYASHTFLSNMAATQGTEGSMIFDTIQELNEHLGFTEPMDERAFTADNLKFASEIIDGRHRGLNWISRGGGTFVRVPGEGREDSAWGALSGKIIPADIWVAMNDTSDRNPMINSKIYNESLQFWKKTKTIYNPGTQITNVAANVILSMFHGIPLRNTLDASKLLVQYEVAPEKLSEADMRLVIAFTKSGAQIGNFASTEIKQIYSKSLENSLSPIKEDTVKTKIAAFIRSQTRMTKAVEEKGRRAGLKGKELAEYVDNAMMQAYNMGDNVFRFAAFMTKAGDLMVDRGETTPSERTIRDAGVYAKRAFIDYDIDAPAIKALRQSLLPFVSYTYGIIPVLARIAATKPWMIANTMAAMALLDGAMSVMAGDDDEMRKLGPEGLNDRVFGFGPRMHLRLPFLGDDDSPVYLRWGDYVPFDSAVRGGLPNQFAGQEWWPQGLSPSNPFLTVGITMFGYDAFTGKPIWENTQSDMDKLQESMKYVYTTFAPPFASHYTIGKAEDVLTGKVGITGESPSAAMLMFSRVAGLKLDNFNVAEEAAYRQIRASATFRDYKAAINKARRDELRTGSPDYEALNDEVMSLYDRMFEEYNDIYKIEDEE